MAPLARGSFRTAFRVDLKGELKEFLSRQRRGDVSIERLNIVVENENLQNVAVRSIPGRKGLKVAISRIRRANQSEVEAVTGDTPLHVGDIVLAVGPAPDLEEFCRILGRVSGIDLRNEPGDVTFCRSAQ